MYFHSTNVASYSRLWIHIYTVDSGKRDIIVVGYLPPVASCRVSYVIVGSAASSSRDPYALDFEPRSKHLEPEFRYLHRTRSRETRSRGLRLAIRRSLDAFIYSQEVYRGSKPGEHGTCTTRQKRISSNTAKYCRDAHACSGSTELISA